MLQCLPVHLAWRGKENESLNMMRTYIYNIYEALIGLLFPVVSGKKYATLVAVHNFRREHDVPGSHIPTSWWASAFLLFAYDR